jgi:hypothetical protein
VAPCTLRDLSVLGRATVEDYVYIRDASELHTGRTSAQSLAVGGADPDLIYDGMLINLESTAQPGLIKRP